MGTAHSDVLLLTARFARSRQPPPRSQVAVWAEEAGLSIHLERQPTLRDFKRACQTTHTTYEDTHGQSHSLMATPGQKRKGHRLGYDVFRDDGVKVAALVYTQPTAGWKGSNRLDYQPRPDLEPHHRDGLSMWLAAFHLNYRGPDDIGWEQVRLIYRDAVAAYGVPLMDRDLMAITDLSHRERFERLAGFAEHFEGSFDLSLLRVRADDSDYTLFRMSADLHFELATREVLDLIERAASVNADGPGRPPRETHLARAVRRKDQLDTILPVYEKALDWPMPAAHATLRRAADLLRRQNASPVAP